MQLSIEHIGLAAQDPQRLAKWYCDVLGAKLIFQTDDQPPAFFVQFGRGVIIEIYASERSHLDTGFNRLAGWRHLALRVKSIEEAKAELSKRGVEFRDEVKPAGGGGAVLFFRDPEGNLLHLVERPAQSFASNAVLGSN